MGRGSQDHSCQLLVNPICEHKKWNSTSRWHKVSSQWGRSPVHTPMCASPPPTSTLDLLLFVPLKQFLEMVGEMLDESNYLLFVVLTVHVQHKQVIAQAADGDACNREQSDHLTPDLMLCAPGVHCKTSPSRAATAVPTLRSPAAEKLCANMAAERLKRLQGDRISL